MSKKILLFQGIIFQSRERLGIGHDAAIGARATVGQQTTYSVFAGIIHHDPVSKQYRCGAGMDVYGQSEILGFSMSAEAIAFSKLYDGDNRGIDYMLQRDPKQKDVWLGTWAGKGRGEGQCRFIFTEVTEQFFSP